jgi:hypothetical protein
MRTEQPARLLHDPPQGAAPPRWRLPAAALGGILALCPVAAVAVRALDGADEPRSATLEAGETTGSTQALLADNDERSPAGATAAAVRFLTAYGSPAMYDAERRRKVVADITSPTVRSQVQAQVDEAFGLAAQNLGLDERGRSPDGQLVARAVPVGSRVVDFTEDTAVIAVWATALLGVAGLGSPYPVQESWSTETVTLEWTESGWRWVSFQHADGPAPIGSAQVPADAETIARAAQQFAEVVDAR